MNIIFDKLTQIIKEYDSFIIAGHKDPDLDSLGSSLGLYEIIESFKKQPYLFLDVDNLKKYNTNINQAINKMDKNIICVNKKDFLALNGKTLLIVTDLHKSERLEDPSLINEYDVVVLDHHIKDKKYIKENKFLYIDSNLSSMSEFVTFYAKNLNVTFDNVISTILLGGIEIDTNSYNIKTTSSTYEAASILMKMGADTILKQELLKETKDDYIKRVSLIKNSFMINDNIAMCIANSIITTMDLAITAEELITLDNVEASFVIGKLEKDVVGISARSLGKIEVSEIMKKMGGGGHNANAACQIKGKTIKEIKSEIINLIGI